MFAKMGKKAKEAKEAERKEEMKKAIRDFFNLVKNFMAGKSDDQIDWLTLSKVAYDYWYQLVEEFPEVAELWRPEVRPEERVYSWLDDELCYHYWDYPTMLEHKQRVEETHVWDQYKNDLNKQNLTLEDIGPMGGRMQTNYWAVAYLSFAYLTKGFYKDFLVRIEKFLN